MKLRSILGVAVVWATCVSGASPARANDFQVNTYTTDDQEWPSVAVDADGGFVVVWHSEGSGDTDVSGTSIQAQRYAADGSTAGGEFQVNTYTPDHQRYPAVAFDGDGNFVVVWHSDGSDGSDIWGYSIQAQRYTADGSTLGDQFQVNTLTTDRQGSPAVARIADGGFIVVWRSEGLIAASGDPGSAPVVVATGLDVGLDLHLGLLWVEGFGSPRLQQVMRNSWPNRARQRSGGALCDSMRQGGARRR